MQDEGRATVGLLPSQNDLFSIIEAIHDNVAIVDNTGTMRWVSSCFERTYNVRREDIIGRTTYELEAQKVFSPSVAALVLQTRRVVTLTESTREGQYNIVTGIPVYDDNGEVCLVVSFSVDMRYSLALYAEYEKIVTLVRDTATPAGETIPGVVAVSSGMQEVLGTVAKVSGVDISLLITGESGVGKNVIARLVHQLGHRRDGPFVEINCAGIPESLLESELFGYEGGAFTGAQAQGKQGRIALAHNGTLFLDEIGELSLALQAKLLQVIQEKQIVKLGGVQPSYIDFRLVTATNQNLEALVEKKRFRSDLFFRLNVMPICIAPLRERPEDILPLCRTILDKMSLRYGMRKQLSPAVEKQLLAYQWPGNIRELNNVLERMLVVAEGTLIQENDLPAHIRACQTLFSPESTLQEAMENLERHMVMSAYRQHGTTVATAKALGISQPSAVRKIRKYRNG